MQEVETEKSSYGIFERILYLFIIPIMFTAILTVVLLSIFDYDVMNSILKAANKVPVLEKIVPDPIEDKNDQTAVSNSENQLTASEEVEALNELLNDKNNEIQTLGAQIAQKEAEIASLIEQIENLKAQAASETITEEEYRQNIRNVANIYADMLPSKSAAIIQNLTLSERVLVLSEMKKNDQVRILEKMPPQIAAETSILLKDERPVDELQIQALQERLFKLVQTEEESAESLNMEELAYTFSSMKPASAASILLNMRNTDAAKVTSILRTMNFQARSAILEQIASESEEAAAEITAKLG